MTIEYRHNVSNAAAVAKHLTECDADFEPRLSQRVELAAYAHKLVAHAERFEAWNGVELVGLVAAYCNDIAARHAFITSVSVSARWMGKGLGVRLMKDCLAHAVSAGMAEVRLEVSRANARAIGLYEKLGFVAVPSTGPLVAMRRALGVG